ncbi:hypothetical protein ACWXVX_21895, partial [Pantoea dispersa]
RVECGLQGLGAFVKDALSPSMATTQNLIRVKAFAAFPRLRIYAHLVAARFIAQWLVAINGDPTGLNAGYKKVWVRS